MLNSLILGQRYAREIMISNELTVPELPAVFTGLGGMPRVFATPNLVAFIEWICIDFLADKLGPDQQSVGSRVVLDHLAPTPPALRVMGEVELTSVEGRKLSFAVTCRDDAGAIATATHDRIIVDRTRFGRLVNDKLAAVAKRVTT